MAKRRRKQKLPEELVRSDIESLSHDGRGVARVDGKTVFVDGALAGETVNFQYTRLHKSYDEAKAVEVITASADRVEAKCAHFGVCGGCSMMHQAPAAQLSHKQATLSEQLEHFGQIQPQQWLEPLTGPEWGYRRKARLGVKYVHKKKKCWWAFVRKVRRLLPSCHAVKC